MLSSRLENFFGYVDFGFSLLVVNCSTWLRFSFSLASASSSSRLRFSSSMSLEFVSYKTDKTGSKTKHTIIS